MRINALILPKTLRNIDAIVASGGKSRGKVIDKKFNED